MTSLVTGNVNEYFIGFYHKDMLANNLKDNRKEMSYCTFALGNEFICYIPSFGGNLYNNVHPDILKLVI